MRPLYGVFALKDVSEEQIEEVVVAASLACDERVDTLGKFGDSRVDFARIHADSMHNLVGHLLAEGGVGVEPVVVDLLGGEDVGGGDGRGEAVAVGVRDDVVAAVLGVVDVEGEVGGYGGGGDGGRVDAVDFGEAVRLFADEARVRIDAGAAHEVGVVEGVVEGSGGDRGGDIDGRRGREGDVGGAEMEEILAVVGAPSFPRAVGAGNDAPRPRTMGFVFVYDFEDVAVLWGGLLVLVVAMRPAEDAVDRIFVDGP